VLWLKGDRSLSDVADTLSDGRLARLLLGIVLGAGLAFVLAQGSAKTEPSGVLDADPPGGDPSTMGSKSEALPANLVLSVGAALLVVALTAPHIDGWLRHVTGLKSPIIELQLAGSTTHRVAVAEGTAILFNLQSLKYLISYDQMIAADEEYFQQFPEGLSHPKTTKEQLESLRRTFHDVIRPVAECVQDTIDKNWLSTEAARRLTAPTVDHLEQIVFGEQRSPIDQLVEEKMHDDFWQSVTQLPEDIIREIPLASNIRECGTKMPLIATLPYYREFKHLPYLHAAAALLISFMGDTDKALDVLQRAYKEDNGQMLEFKDYRFLYVMGKLAFSQGDNDVKLYYNPLNEMWKLATDHEINFRSKNAQCSADPKKISPLCYAQIYQVVAADLAAYYLAEDLARGNQRAARYKSRIKEFCCFSRRSGEGFARAWFEQSILFLCSR
jgi:hypothetical protein